MTARTRRTYVKPLRRNCLVVDETYDTPDAAQQASAIRACRGIHPVAYYRDNGFFHRASLEYADGEVRERGELGEERFLPVGLRPDATGRA
jgi:hypothetical protein